MAANLRTFVIANPKARAGAVEREWERIERLIRAQIPELDVAFTEGPGHATLLAREALRAGFEMIVAVGGDGTFNEVVNGFYEKPAVKRDFEIDEDGWLVRAASGVAPINPDAAFGVIPVGTGGDFRRTVGLMGGFKDTIEHLGGDHTRNIDLGQITYVNHDGDLESRFFVNIASAGFSGDVDRHVNKMWKGLGGKLSFRLASVRAFVGWRNSHLRVRLDDVEEIDQQFLNVVVANGEYFGGGMWVAPGAELDDGRFQVVFLGDLGKWDALTVSSAIYSGSHLEYDQVFRRHAKTVSIQPDVDRDVLIDVDGEQPGRVPALFEMHERVLPLKI